MNLLDVLSFSSLNWPHVKYGMPLLNFNLTVITCGTSASGAKQVARLLADSEDGFLNKHRFLIHDRDPLFTEEFKEILKTPKAKTKTLKLPAKSPNLNFYSERYVKTVKFECLNHLILLSIKQLEYVIEEF